MLIIYCSCWDALLYNKRLSNLAGTSGKLWNVQNVTQMQVQRLREREREICVWRNEMCDQNVCHSEAQTESQSGHHLPKLYLKSEIQLMLFLMSLHRMCNADMEASQKEHLPQWICGFIRVVSVVQGKALGEWLYYDFFFFSLKLWKCISSSGRGYLFASLFFL